MAPGTNFWGTLAVAGGEKKRSWQFGVARKPPFGKKLWGMKTIVGHFLVQWQVLPMVCHKQIPITKRRDQGPFAIWNNIHQSCFSICNRSSDFPFPSAIQVCRYRKIVSHPQNAEYGIHTPTKVTVFLFTCFFVNNTGSSSSMGVNPRAMCSAFRRPVNPGLLFDFAYSWRKFISSSLSWLSSSSWFSWLLDIVLMLHLGSVQFSSIQC